MGFSLCGSGAFPQAGLPLSGSGADEPSFLCYGPMCCRLRFDISRLTHIFGSTALKRVLVVRQSLGEHLFICSQHLAKAKGRFEPNLTITHFEPWHLPHSRNGPTCVGGPSGTVNLGGWDDSPDRDLRSAF